MKDLSRHTRLITAEQGNLLRFDEDHDGDSGTKVIPEKFSRTAENLRLFGLDSINGPVDEVARAIASRRIRDTLLGFLWTWHNKLAYFISLWEKGRLGGRPIPGFDPAVRDRLAEVVRNARQLCGGKYARWQDLVDRKPDEDPPMRNSFKSLLWIEPLVDRTTPATLVSPTAVTYQDLDGDQSGSPSPSRFSPPTTRTQCLASSPTRWAEPTRSRNNCDGSTIGGKLLYAAFLDGAVVAEHIGELSVRGSHIRLHPSASNDQFLLGGAGTLRAHEIQVL